MTLAIIVGWIGACVIVSLAVYGGFELLNRLETYFATRNRLVKETTGDGADGDCFPCVLHNHGDTL